MTIYCFIPFIIVLTGNCLIIYLLDQNPSEMSTNEGSTSTMTRHESTSCNSGCSRVRIYLLLLTISFTWFLLMLPYSIVGAVKTLLDNDTTRIICFTLMHINHAINFFLYCLSGRKFREEFMSIFPCCWKKKVMRYAGVRSTFRTELPTSSSPLRLKRNMFTKAAPQDSLSSLPHFKDLPPTSV